MLLFHSCDLQDVCSASLTHGRKQLGHLLWVALLAGCEDPEQTVQTKLGQAAALLLLPHLLHRARDVGVAPHQDAARQTEITRHLQLSQQRGVKLQTAKETKSQNQKALKDVGMLNLVMSQRKRKVLSECCPSGPSVCPVSSSC